MTKIFKYPNPVLLREAEKVEQSEVLPIVKRLNHARSLVKWGKMRGLAAPQIGISKRLFLLFPDAAPPEIYVNPRIIRAKDFHEQKEGCYSLEANKFDYAVKRPTYLFLEWSDAEGQRHRQEFMGKSAQAIHHEMEHLESKLCVSNASNSDNSPGTPVVERDVDDSVGADDNRAKPINKRVAGGSNEVKHASA